MRRYTKKKLLDLMKSMEQAQDLIKKQKNEEVILRLLQDCQASAVQIGNTLERLDIDLSAQVSLLEEYCDQAYYLSQKESEDKSASLKHLKKMCSLLNKVKNFVQYDTGAETLEVVFLPYKASMWDSLESIWKVANEDPSCISYVVPIPYFDKSPSGALQQMHYEGTEFPEEVSITDWRSYNIAERHPDVIYIHNPYDNCNRVTSIHPDFYSEKLKDCTDMLIYIPYFVSDGKVDAHFCVCPGTLYAHRVVVQSEKIRQIYIEEYIKFVRKHDCEHQFGSPEKKFIALGSPKFDKVRSAKKEDFQLPEQWKLLIQKESGESKKVILYNTTIHSLLKYESKMLKKLSFVLSIFEKNRGDMVLWWRPHPLLKTTISSMLPHLLDDFERIESDYIKGGWGIYDTSQELYRAITYTDAYLGDWSSVEILYKETGKPIMIVNYELEE